MIDNEKEIILEALRRGADLQWKESEETDVSRIIFDDAIDALYRLVATAKMNFYNMEAERQGREFWEAEASRCGDGKHYEG